MATNREFMVAGRCQQAQEKFRRMIFRLSCRLGTSDCVSIRYLANLPTSECCSGEDKANLPLHVLSSLEANGHISPSDVEFLEFLLSEIHHEELLQIVSTYKESKEYKNALKERKKIIKREKASKGACEVRICSGDQSVGEASDRKRRRRALYTLLITHITGLTQVMEILREELDKIGEDGVELAMERFLQVAQDGENFTDNLHKVFQDMGIKSNRNSTSSNEETPAATPNGGKREHIQKVIIKLANNYGHIADLYRRGHSSLTSWNQDIFIVLAICLKTHSTIKPAAILLTWIKGHSSSCCPV